jgi:hypothetical protein
MLAACVELTNPDDPGTAHVNYRLAHALRAWLASQQEWEGSVNRHQPPAPQGVGSARTSSHHPAVASAEQAALGPPPNRPGTPGRRGSSRKQVAPKLLGRGMALTGSTFRTGSRFPCDRAEATCKLPGESDRPEGV